MRNELFFGRLILPMTQVIWRRIARFFLGDGSHSARRDGSRELKTSAWS
jgi:hypothetical protein